MRRWVEAEGVAGKRRHWRVELEWVGFELSWRKCILNVTMNAAIEIDNSLRHYSVQWWQ